MDSIKKSFDQFMTLFKSMSPSQRGTFSIVTLFVIGTFVFLLFNGSPEQSYTSLSVGKVFSVEEIIHAEEALINAGLTDFKRKGQRLTVPRNEVEKYNSALIASGTMPQNWAEEWEKQFSGLGPFANNKQMSERKEIARAKLASQMVSTLPDIESANVVWDQEETKRWPARTRSTATVFVRTKPGKSMKSSLVKSIQMSIAGMKADLNKDDVTIFDLSSGIAHQAEDQQDPFGSGMLRRVNELKDMYRAEVLRAIDYIDFVRVAVNVDIEKVKSSIRRSQTIETANSVTLVSKEKKNSRTSDQTPQRQEPGQGANAALNLTNAVAGVKQSEVVEDSDSTQITVPSFEVTQDALIGAMPESVNVSVSIPEEYYKAVAMQSGVLAADATPDAIKKEVAKVKTQINTAVQTSVAKIIPTKDPAEPLAAVDVSSYVRIPTVVPPASTGWFDTTLWVVAQWGSAIALGFLTLWAFSMLNRHMKQSIATTPPVPELPKQAAEEAREEEDEEPLPTIPRPDTRNRDTLQLLVRDNPEMTAAILRGWVQDAL